VCLQYMLSGKAAECLCSPRPQGLRLLAGGGAREEKRERRKKRGQRREDREERTEEREKRRGRRAGRRERRGHHRRQPVIIVPSHPLKLLSLPVTTLSRTYIMNSQPSPYVLIRSLPVLPLLMPVVVVFVPYHPAQLPSPCQLTTAQLHPSARYKTEGSSSRSSVVWLPTVSGVKNFVGCELRTRSSQRLESQSCKNSPLSDKPQSTQRPLPGLLSQTWPCPRDSAWKL